MAKRSKLKVRKFSRLILAFAEVTGEELVGRGGRGAGGLFAPPHAE